MPGNTIFRLERKLDTTAARTLASGLLRHRGHPLQIDGSAVETVGGLAIEVLISAAFQWQADGHPFSVVHASRQLETVCNTFGLRSDAPWLTRENPEGTPA